MSKTIGHPTPGSGDKKTFKQYLKREQTHTHTHKRTLMWTNELIESISPEGRCFENLICPSHEDKEYGPDDIIKDHEKNKHDYSLDNVSEDEKTDGEDDDAFLAKFDENGRLIE